MVDLLSFHLHRHWIYLLQNCFLPNIWDSPSRQESSQPFLRPAESMVYPLGCDTLPLPGSPIIWVLWRNCKDWDTKVLSDVERVSHPTSTSEKRHPPTHLFWICVRCKISSKLEHFNGRSGLNIGKSWRHFSHLVFLEHNSYTLLSVAAFLQQEGRISLVILEG